MIHFKKNIFVFIILSFFSSCVTQSSFSPKRSSGYSSYHKLMWPLHGKITSYYGMRDGKFHHGIDIKGPRDRNIYAAARGVVEFSGSLNGYGKTVIVRHKNYKTLYAHCLRLKVKKGQKVRKGQTVGTVGTSGRSSGYHLHFEYRNLADSSRDPLIFLR